MTMRIKSIWNWGRRADNALTCGTDWQVKGRNFLPGGSCHWNIYATQSLSNSNLIVRLGLPRPRRLRRWNGFFYECGASVSQNEFSPSSWAKIATSIKPHNCARMSAKNVQGDLGTWEANQFSNSAGMNCNCVHQFIMCTSHTGWMVTSCE